MTITIRTAFLTVCAAALGMATSALAQTRLNPMDNGNISVDMRGCSVLFSRSGSIVTKGSSCNNSDVTEARNAFSSYQREQGASDHSYGGNHNRGGGPDYWEVTGSPGNNLAIYRDPEMGSRYVVDGIRNGDRLRNYGCERHGGENWCEVQYRSDRGWIRQRFLRQAGSSYSSSSYDSGGSVAYIRGAGNNGLEVHQDPSNSSRVITSGIQNHTRITNHGCGKHGGKNWCEIDVGGYRGWVRKKFVHKNQY